GGSRGPGDVDPTPAPHPPGPRAPGPPRRAAPPAPVRGNPTGAGDSAVAGLLSGLVEQLPWPARLARAVALATATVLAPTAGEFDAEAYEQLLPRVTVTEHPGP
ncbi:PfkB family carbohydrate kinase, partial [Streptomyces sp. NPDC055037]